MLKFKNKREGFTLIELIVVMAVLAILVLLAAPRLLNYTKEATATHIKNDVKVVESVIEEYLIKNNDQLNNDLDLVDLSEAVGDGTLWDIKGRVDVLPSDDHYDITDMKEVEAVRSKLGGSFTANNDGKVYYIHTAIIGDSDNQSEVEDNCPVVDYGDLGKPLPLTSEMRNWIDSNPYFSFSEFNNMTISWNFNSYVMQNFYKYNGKDLFVEIQRNGTNQFQGVIVDWKTNEIIHPYDSMGSIGNWSEGISVPMPKYFKATDASFELNSAKTNNFTTQAGAIATEIDVTEDMLEFYISKNDSNAFFRDGLSAYELNGETYLFGVTQFERYGHQYVSIYGYKLVGDTWTTLKLDSRGYDTWSFASYESPQVAWISEYPYPESFVKIIPQNINQNECPIKIEFLPEFLSEQ